MMHNVSFDSGDNVDIWIIFAGKQFGWTKAISEESIKIQGIGGKVLGASYITSVFVD